VEDCQCVLDFSGEGLFPSGFFFLFLKKKYKCFCFALSWEVEDFAVSGTPVPKKSFSLPRALTYEAERTLDLPRHGAAWACPWLSMVSIAGSVPTARGGDRYSQRRSQGGG